MPIDSAQKRMSAMLPGMPFRGPLVDATESGFNQGNRQAATFQYSGILVDPPPDFPLPGGGNLPLKDA